MLDYDQKKNLNILSAGLVHTTQAKLKKECIRLLRKGKLHGKDEKVIRDFCEDWDEAKTCLQNIEKYDVDKFKPLSNFLKGYSESTDDKNIQLLAWLIDFPHRPYVSGKDYSTVETMLREGRAEGGKEDTVVAFTPVAVTNDGRDAAESAGGSVSGHISSGKPVVELIDTISEVVGDSLPDGTGRRLAWPRYKLWILLFVFVILGLVGAFWWRSADSGGGCMYWAGDHYQPIPCDRQMPNTLVVALDMDKLQHFKKIMHPETITYKDMGRLWYSKINNRIEFFTADGDHPVVIDRHLKPISEYIIDTYIHPGMTSN